MLVKLLSDLHLGGNNPFRYVDHGEYVCVLAGDVSEGIHGVEWALANIPSHIRVLYVPGNHEYYGQDVEALNARFAHYNRMDSHVHVLMEESVEVGDLRFVGTTLWTDFNLYGNQPLHGEVWRRGLNDSVWIRNGGRKIVPQDFIDWNKLSLAFLEHEVNQPTDKTRVLVTHYCFEFSVAPRYRNDPLTVGFATKIPQHIHEKFTFHFHGHTHDKMDYEMPYGTKVLCNPRGYAFENGQFNQELVLDI